jgi:hypothetical protein
MPYAWTKLSRAQRREVELAEIATAGKDWPPALQRWQAILESFGRSPSVDEALVRHVRFNVSLLKRLIDLDGYKARLEAHGGSRPQPGKRKIAVYTSFTEGYDNLKLPEVIDDRLDYIVYTDHQLDGMGVFDVRPLPRPDNDGARAIRYPKTHPHVLLNEYETAVWVDTSLMVVGDLHRMVDAFMESGRAIGSSDHPYRKSIYEEFEACVRLKKDDYRTMKRQMDYYRSIGFDTDDLSENTVLMFNLKDPALTSRLAAAMETWWEQICRFSKRDQLSLNYALSTHDVLRYHLMQAPDHVHVHPTFVFVPHQSEHEILTEFYRHLRSHG